MISVGSGNWLANILGSEKFQRWLSTDFHKNKQMLKKIFERSIEQVDNVNYRFMEINEKETNTNYHARY